MLVAMHRLAIAAVLAVTRIALADPADPTAARPAAGIRALLEPSDVEVVARVPGRPAFVTRLHAVAGATVAVDVAAFAAPHDEPVATQRARSYLYVAGGLGGAGTIAVATSIVL